MTCLEENLTIPPPGPVLEGRLSYDEGLAQCRGRILIVPPHPFLGGDMENNVIAGLARGLAKEGFLTMRFNYRGIGGSESDRDLGRELALFWKDSTAPDYEAAMMEDANRAFQFLAAHHKEPLGVVGYSFGALSAMTLLAAMSRAEVGVFISPPLVKWPLPPSFFTCNKKKTLLTAPGDFACPEEEMAKLVERLPPPVTWRSLPGGDHFFIGREEALAQAVAIALQPEGVS